MAQVVKKQKKRARLNLYRMHNKEDRTVEREYLIKFNTK